MVGTIIKKNQKIKEIKKSLQLRLRECRLQDKIKSQIFSFIEVILNSCFSQQDKKYHFSKQNSGKLTLIGSLSA